MSEDLFGEVPAGNPDIDLILGFLKSAGIKLHKANQKRAVKMLETWTVEQIQAGIILGLDRARLAGSHPKYLVYFRGPIQDAVAAGPAYVEYLRGKHGE